MAVERSDGPTPYGGAYSTAIFSRDGKPATKEEATAVEIIEYAEDGTELMQTVGTIARPA